MIVSILLHKILPAAVHVRKFLTKVWFLQDPLRSTRAFCLEGGGGGKGRGGVEKPCLEGNTLVVHNSSCISHYQDNVEYILRSILTSSSSRRIQGHDSLHSYVQTWHLKCLKHDL